MCNASTMWIPHCASIFQVANTPKKYPTISVREQQNILAGCPVFKLSCRRTDEQLFIHPCRLHREACFWKSCKSRLNSHMKSTLISNEYVSTYIYRQLLKLYWLNQPFLLHFPTALQLSVQLDL